MIQATDSHTTDLPGAPTQAELDAMWLVARRAEQAEADRASYQRLRGYYGRTLSGEAA